MKDILLKIVGKQTFSGCPEPDEIQLMTVGRGGCRDGSIYLRYEESEMSGMENSTTQIKICEDKVEMKRDDENGQNSTLMVFEKGKRFQTLYGTPYGTVEMEILTDTLSCDISPELDGGSLFLQYQFDLKGLGEGKNCLKLEIVPKEE